MDAMITDLFESPKALKHLAPASSRSPNAEPVSSGDGGLFGSWLMEDLPYDEDEDDAPPTHFEATMLLNSGSMDSTPEADPVVEKPAAELPTTEPLDRRRRLAGKRRCECISAVQTLPTDGSTQSSAAGHLPRSRGLEPTSASSHVFEGDLQTDTLSALEQMDCATAARDAVTTEPLLEVEAEELHELPPSQVRVERPPASGALEPPDATTAVTVEATTVEVVAEPIAEPTVGLTAAADTREATGEAMIMPMTQEQAMCDEEEDGRLRFELVNIGSGVKPTVLALLSLKVQLNDELPNLTEHYITEYLFDSAHSSLVCVRDGTVVGGLAYRPHCSSEALEDGDSASFAELTFFAVSDKYKGLGLGTRLMNRFKSVLLQQQLPRILTYADNYALGFFRQHGFSTALTLPPPHWKGVILEYDGGTESECVLHADLPYTRLPHVLRVTRDRRVRQWLDDADGASAPPPLVSAPIHRVPPGKSVQDALLAHGLRLVDPTHAPDYGLGSGCRLEPSCIGDERLRGRTGREQLCEALRDGVAATRVGGSGVGGRSATQSDSACQSNMRWALERAVCEYYSDRPQALADLSRMGVAPLLLSPSSGVRKVLEIDAS